MCRLHITGNYWLPCVSLSVYPAAAVHACVESNESALDSRTVIGDIEPERGATAERPAFLLSAGADVRVRRVRPSYKLIPSNAVYSRVEGAAR
jgi:hypothetical protein